MNKEDRFVARILFRNRIFENTGQAFEDFFVLIMTQSNSEFQAVQAYGNLGDRKNDGFVPSTGTYYQVFAPEDITKNRTIQAAVKKLETDFKELYENWDDQCKIRKFYFVINDKYNGLPVPILEKILDLNKVPEYADIEIAALTAKDLEEIFENLSESKKLDIVGFIPTVSCEMIEYTALNEVVNYLLNTELSPRDDETLIVPDFSKKIAFNNLSEEIAHKLMTGSYQEGFLESYFNEHPGMKEVLQKKFRAMYEHACELIPEDKEDVSDCRFYHILEAAAPKKTLAICTCIEVLMAYYFTTCDIFDEPQ